MEQCRLTVHRKNGIKEHVIVEKGVNLLSALRGIGAEVTAACGGKGTCGKCIVKISGDLEKPSEIEIKKIGYSGISKGYRLSCMNRVNDDLEVHIPDYDEKTVIKTDGDRRNIEFNPIVKKQYYEIGQPDLKDQAGDLERVYKVTGASRCNFEIVKSLPSLLRNSDYKITATVFDDELLSVEAGDLSKSLYGIAVDIGTTTIAAYLMDLKTGEKISVYSQMNPQRSYGADVISRITYTIDNPNGLSELKNVMTDCMNDIISYFCMRKKINCRDISLVTVVGNTTMLHLLLGLEPKNMAVVPFIPVTTSLLTLDLNESGIDAAPGAKLIVYPCVSAYIGADTVAAILSSGLYESEKPCLLLDLGTNGEIALGDKNEIFTCSTAAGPAFEGANIRNGMPGIGGAIDMVRLINTNNKPEFTYSTIASGKPVGICGSGIVDAIAEMLKAGIADYTGRINAPDEMPEETAACYGDRIVEIDGQKAFLLIPQSETGNESDICITQKDIRELQNAKAAIAAGVNILIKESGIDISNLGSVYLAGGMGSYIDINNALAIGLIPNKTEGKVRSIGNAAGSGAVEGLLSRDMIRKTYEISKKIKYIELSARSDFMDEYMECMMFGNFED